MGNKMKLALAIFAFASPIAANLASDEVYVRSNGDISNDGKNWESDPKGPRMCNGDKIPDVNNGKWICKRNNEGGNPKKGKGRKCRLKCDKDFEVWSIKQNRPYSDGVVKCKSNKGWKRKPGKVTCKAKLNKTYSSILYLFAVRVNKLFW